MAKGKKYGGRDFQPGNHFAKLGGRPLIPDDLKAVKKITTEEAERLITALMKMTAQELVALCKDSETPAMHVIIGNIILKGMSGGDTQRMEFLFNRTIGRVLDKVQISTTTPFVIKRPSGEIEMGVKDVGDETE